MNRRLLLTSTVPAIGLLLANSRLALARMKDFSTPDPTDQDKPAIVLDEYSHDEALYLGALTTWLELLEGSLDPMYEGIEAMEENPDSSQAKAMVLMPLGVWKHLPLDAEKFEGPEVFALAHTYAVRALTHLGSAAEIIATGVVSNSPTAITLGTEHINLASDEIGKLMAALPFERPRREEFFD